MTIKMREGLRSLRYHDEHDAVYEALVRTREAGSGKFRVIAYSVQSNHLHLIVEAESNGDLQTGMRGLMARIGNALRKLWDLRGGLFADRYHLEILRSPTRMRNAYRYVLNNARKHGSWIAKLPDPYSSGPWFRGWNSPVPAKHRPNRPSPCSSPRTWLATVGWHRAGPHLAFADTPPNRTRRRPSHPSPNNNQAPRPSPVPSTASPSALTP